jgi:hypothetical protein
LDDGTLSLVLLLRAKFPSLNFRPQIKVEQVVARRCHGYLDFASHAVLASLRKVAMLHGYFLEGDEFWREKQVVGSMRRLYQGRKSSYIDLFESNSSTYDHRLRSIGHPVRSAIHKPQIGGLVVGWVTTSESPLLYVLSFLTFLHRAAARWVRQAFLGGGEG